MSQRHTHSRDIEGILRSQGLRVTPQRRAVYTLIARASSPLSAEKICARARGALDLATVYRTLDTFTKAGIVRAVFLGSRSEKFELADCHHHYIMCRSCNKTETIHTCLPSATLKAFIREQPSFARIDDHTLELYGTCVSCAETQPLCA